MPDVLICDRDRSFAGSLEAFLVACGYTTEVLGVGSRAVQKLLSGPCGAVVLGVCVDDAEGLEMIPLIHQIDRELPIVAVGDRESLELERKVRLEKVFYYTVQPVDFEEVKAVLHRALAGREGRGEVRE